MSAALTTKDLIARVTCGICRHYAWDTGVMAPVVVRGQVHHPSCKLVPAPIVRAASAPLAPLPGAIAPSRDGFTRRSLGKVAGIAEGLKGLVRWITRDPAPPMAPAPALAGPPPAPALPSARPPRVPARARATPALPARRAAR